MFHSLDPKIRKRLERRYAELQVDPKAFIRRFDLNNDGILDANEKQAALSTLAHELLREDALSRSLNDTKLSEGMTLRQRYQILSEIGNGAQGIAYAARDSVDNKIVVIKQLRLSHLEAWDAYDSFRREAEVLAQLSHPRLPRFIDAFKIEKNSKFFYFSVQSLMPGLNLADRLQRGEFFTEETLISIASQCLEILNYLHLNLPSVLHRDIKPANLLLDDSGRLSLVDFGAVQYANASKTMAVGTAGYMASEQLSGNAMPQSDLYSLGATLIRLATRVNPHELELKHMRMVWRHHASLSDGFSNWIDKLIDPEIEDRFRNAKSAKSFLEGQKNIFVRRETKKDSRLSLELIEQFVEKPADTKVRIWESVDQFICTFPRSGVKPISIVGTFSKMMRVLFEAKHYRDLLEYGGGFSFDANAQCKITTKYGGRDVELMNRKLKKIENMMYEAENYGLVGAYTLALNGGEHGSKEIRVYLAVGLDRLEIGWVTKRLRIFLASHAHRLM